MSHITTEYGGGHGAAGGGQEFHSHFGPIDLSPANTMVERSWGKMAMAGFLLVGLVCIGLTFAYPHLASGDERAAQHMWASYLVGAVVSVGLMLGCMGWVMKFRAVQAGWWVSFSRQVENVASLMPLSILFIAPLFLAGPLLWNWMAPEAHGDHMIEARGIFQTPGFFWIRIAVYMVVWSLLALRLFGLSKRQDATGDRLCTTKAQLTCTWGLLVFGLTTAFGAFDLIMSLDYHWFSTMFGVYWFAGNALSSMGLIILVVSCLRSSGKLNRIVTQEHFHDMGKLLMAFTVFWAYIGFSQYFLIWYANIPEETAWFSVRTQNGWQYIGTTMMFGHFLAPFLLLLWKNSKRVPALLAFFALWQISMQCLDMFWLIRPTVYASEHIGNMAVAGGKIGFSWVDITGLLGPLCVFLGLLVWRIRSGSLIPTHDPRMHEALNHKNYV